MSHTRTLRTRATATATFATRAHTNARPESLLVVSRRRTSSPREWSGFQTTCATRRRATSLFAVESSRARGRADDAHALRSRAIDRERTRATDIVSRRTTRGRGISPPRGRFALRGGQVTRTSKPRQPDATMRASVGWNLTVHGVRGWPTNWHLILRRPTPIDHAPSTQRTTRALRCGLDRTAGHGRELSSVVGGRRTETDGQIACAGRGRACNDPLCPCRQRVPRVRTRAALGWAARSAAGLRRATKKTCR